MTCNSWKFQSKIIDNSNFNIETAKEILNKKNKYKIKSKIFSEDNKEKYKIIKGISDVGMYLNILIKEKNYL